MHAVVQQRELANLDNIGIIQNENKGEYLIVTEWSLLPIESYNNMSDAIDFCRGFKGLPIHPMNMSKAYNNGCMYRSYIDIDINQYGQTYNKVNDLSKNIMQTIER